MGQFLNTYKTDTMNSLIKGIENRLDNSFYIFNDKHPTVVTFYNINDTRSTLDEGSKQIYALSGEDTPLIYNRIDNVFLYGLERMQTELEVGEYGLESTEIQGECYLPPNTFAPYPDSYFTINHLKKNYWFRVTKVSTDTLENGNNFWKLEYLLDKVGEFDIEKRVVKRFRMLADHIGSNFKSVIQDEVYDFVGKLESICNTLANYYHSLFFKPQLQTYTFRWHTGEFYNPETIEFIIRNKLLSMKDEYVYVDQAIHLPDTFCIQYDYSIYRNVEKCCKRYIHKKYYGLVNTDPMSLLSTRLEDYFIVHPNNLGYLADPLPIYPPELMGAINDASDFGDAKNRYYKIIQNYFNEEKNVIDDDLLEALERMNYSDEITVYHVMPIFIFILTKEIEKLMADNSDTDDFKPIGKTLNCNCADNLLN